MPIDHVAGGLLYVAILCLALFAMTYGAGSYICRKARDLLFGGQVPESFGAKVRGLLKQRTERGILALLLLGLSSFFFMAAIAFTLMGIWFQSLSSQLLSPFQMKILSFGLIAMSVLLGLIAFVRRVIGATRKNRN